MINTCHCGGRLAPYNPVHDPLVARFKCEKCGLERTQRKRQPGISFTFKSGQPLWTVVRDRMGGEMSPILSVLDVYPTKAQADERAAAIGKHWRSQELVFRAKGT